MHVLHAMYVFEVYIEQATCSDTILLGNRAWIRSSPWIPAQRNRRIERVLGMGDFQKFWKHLSFLTLGRPSGKSK